MTSRRSGSAHPLDASETMNVWLHKQAIETRAENGGKVPADCWRA